MPSVTRLAANNSAVALYARASTANSKKKIWTRTWTPAHRPKLKLQRWTLHPDMGRLATNIVPGRNCWTANRLDPQSCSVDSTRRWMYPTNPAVDRQIYVALRPRGGRQNDRLGRRKQFFHEPLAVVRVYPT